jgi:hypothetical protein
MRQHAEQVVVHQDLAGATDARADPDRRDLHANALLYPSPQSGRSGPAPVGTESQALSLSYDGRATTVRVAPSNSPSACISA